ncbi:MAG: HsdR family type I site-specific deoxyribonuclease [Anaerolineae bacterium]
MILSNDKSNDTIRLDEKSHVEEPFLAQLERLGWQVLRLDQKQTPAHSFRADFGKVVLEPHLAAALRKINPFLRDDQVAEVIRRITTFQSGNLIENNRRVLDLLLENTSVAVNHDTGETRPTVRFIDFKTRANNSFLAIAQFKVRIPGAEHHIIPDIVLFINGLPIAIVECKSSKVKEPIAEAIDQLMRYSQQRGEGAEGNQELFYYNQFLVATCRNICKFGTITTHIEKYWYRWLDPYPLKLDDLPHEGTTPNDQQRLVAGMLAKDNLLDLIQTFTIFGLNERGQTVKLVARYQQFRAVKLAVKRLLEGGNRRARSGIIWHTQGSGKSLTMMFMVREMRKHLALGSWKIVFVTDRTQLEQQLTETGQGSGQRVKVAEWINPDPNRPGKSLKELIANDTPDLVMAMIHKFQERDLHEIFPRLNDSPNILIMVDEAHRSQYQTLGANLDRAMPNASRIAYTGTPIDKTEETFGDYIDKYTMRQSVADGTTLEIVYEGRTQNAQVTDPSALDKRFEDVFSEYNLVERLQILGYGSRDAYLEAEDVIRGKARDMVAHYVHHVLPGGFKAQVVATSREAAVRYKAQLDAALQESVAALELDNPQCINLDRLRTLETAVVISGAHNDKPHLKPYTDEHHHTRSIRRFKLPFDATEGEGVDLVDGRVGILVVNNMLLTGFDAPVEQVLYLDRVIIAHNLLQAIARVNRVGDEHKEKGFVVDYVGVGNDLKRALDSYAEREQQELIESLGNDQANINALIQARREIWDLLKKYGLTGFADPDAFFDLFYDEDIRFEYILAFKKLTRALNLVFPARQALDYLPDYENFTQINALAERHLHDGRLSMRGIPDKLRAITDEYLRSNGITQRIAPISILDADFQKGVQARTRSKTRAAEVEHAIRHYIELNIDQDPELFTSFAEALEKILQEFKDNWDKIYAELEKLRQRMAANEKEQTYGLDRKKHMPIFGIFKRELFDNRELTPDEIAQNVDLTQNTFNLIRQEAQIAGFWNSIPAQSKLKGELQGLFMLERFGGLPHMFDKRLALISRLMEWAKENHGTIMRD